MQLICFWKFSVSEEYQMGIRWISDRLKSGTDPDGLKSVWNPSDERLTASEIIRWLSDIVWLCWLTSDNIRSLSENYLIWSWYLAETVSDAVWMLDENIRCSWNWNQLQLMLSDMQLIWCWKRIRRCLNVGWKHQLHLKLNSAAADIIFIFADSSSLIHLIQIRSNWIVFY